MNKTQFLMLNTNMLNHRIEASGQELKGFLFGNV